jgi:exportin-1
MQQAAAGVDVLDNADNVKILSNVLKTNVAACVAIGPFFLPQLGRIWLDMLGLYGAASNTVSDAVVSQGTYVGTNRGIVLNSVP